LNLKVVSHLAKILALSSVRQKRAKGSVPKGLAKSPITNILFLVVGFPVVAFLTYSFSGAFLKNVVLDAFFLQFSIFLPSFMAFATMMYGVVFEFSQSTHVSSTNVINWLPIRAIDYVLASAVCMAYFMAPGFTLFFGATLGIALSVNMLNIWMFSLVFGILGMFSGAFILEVIRALMNRVSASFYKRGGRSTVAVRMLGSIALMVVFVLIFNVNVLLIILQYFVGGVGNAWFIPVLWPSLAIMSYLAADAVQTIVYAALSVGFTLAILWASVKVRAKYWVPIPVSIKLASSKSYTPKKGILGRLGFTLAETALIRKDLRGLARRKEMIGWIAAPIAIGVISVITAQSSWATATTTIDKLAFFTGPFLGIVLLAFYLALTGVGQEGGAFINLLAAPLKEKEIVKAKLVVALLPATCALIVLLAFIQVMVQPRLEAIIAITVGLGAVVLESTLVGLAVGSRFPDFTEVPKARFVTQKGTLCGMATLGVSLVTTLLPLLIYTFISTSLSLTAATFLTAIIAFVICYVGYRATANGIQELINQAH